MDKRINAIKKVMSALLAVFILTGCLAVFTRAGSGFIETDLLSILQKPAGNTRYLIKNRADLEDYAVFGSFRVKALADKCDKRGETYQAYFACYASHIEYADGGGKIPEVMKPAYTALSFTADENTDEFELVSEKAEYEKITVFGGNAQYLWQIDADGDYTVIGSITGTGFFTSMYQYY